MSKEYEEALQVGCVAAVIVVPALVGVIILRGWALSVVWAWTAVLIWGAAPITVAQGVGVSALVALLVPSDVKLYAPGVPTDAHKRRHWLELLARTAGYGLVVLIAYVASRYYPVAVR
ncbi:MAG TPA: hypothetical protein VI911_04125 [Patescibacteria group bacterium]|nr:hypothetical protein [Patescibacteria group bacterium]